MNFACQMDILQKKQIIGVRNIFFMKNNAQLENCLSLKRKNWEWEILPNPTKLWVSVETLAQKRIGRWKIIVKRRGLHCFLSSFAGTFIKENPKGYQMDGERDIKQEKRWRKSKLKSLAIYDANYAEDASKSIGNIFENKITRAKYRVKPMGDARSSSASNKEKRVYKMWRTQLRQ